MANADISLLFGVLGEGSLSGESGSLIQGQLTQIMSALNKNPLKVKVALDTEAGGQKSWSSQLQSKLDKVSSSGKFSAQVSKLTLGAGAITDFRNQLSAVISTLNLDKGTSITLTAEGIGEITSKMKKAGDAASDAARKTAEFKVQMEALNKQKTSVQRALSSLTANAATDEERAKVAELITKYEQWAIKIEQVRATKVAASGEYRIELEAEGTAITDNINRLNEAAAAAEAAANAKRTQADASKNEADAQKNLDAARKQGLSLLTQMQKAERDWTAAKTGKSSAGYSSIQESITQLQNYLSQLSNGKITVDEFRQRLTGLNSSFTASSNAIKSVGENTKTFSQRIGGLAEKFGTWFSITRVIMAAVRTVRQMVTSTIELDNALTQLKIVTGATDDEMTAFLTRATSLAKELGNSITDVLGSIETFSRLGYNLEDASKLAEFASVLSNVAAVDTEAATTGLTSIIKGFNMDVSESEHVADVLVEVGQKYAVSAGEMMEAYEKSGAALNAANTSFEKSAGLIAAANASVQNASTVGTALKTISARIRGAKSDLEALGEDTDDLAEGFSKYAKELKALTGFDIMVDGSTDTYKDIYDIFGGISKVWDDLSDTQQARVSEILGGVRQLQVVSSILGNWQDAAGAYADAMDSAGVATEANATYMESISGKIGQFKAAFQELSNTLISSDFIGGIVDFGTGLLGVLESLARVIEAIGGLNTVLGITVGIIAVIKADAVAGFLGKLITPIKAIISAIGALIASITAARAAGVTAGQFISNAFNQIAVSASTAQLAMGAIGIALAVITGAVALYNNLRKSTEDLVESSNKLTESFKEFKEQAEENIETIKSLSDEFERLSDGVDRYGRNISLSADDYERYKDIIAEIVGMSPELAEGYDRENGYLVDKNGLLERAIELQEREYQNELRRMATTDKLATALGGSVATYSDLIGGDALTTDTSFSNSIWKLFNVNDRNDIPKEMESGEFLARQIMDSLGIENVDKELEKYFNEYGYWQSGWFWDDYVDKIAEDIQSGHSLILPSIDFEAAGFESKEALDMTIEETKSAVSAYTDVQKELAQANDDVSNQLMLVAESNEQYAELSNSAKQVISNFVDSFNVDDITKDGYFGGKVIDKDAINRVKVQINDFIAKLTPEMQALLDTGFSLKIGLDDDGSELSVKEYKDKVRSLLNDVEDIDDEDIKLYIRTSLEIDEDSDALSADVEKAIEHVKNLLQDEFDGEVDNLSVSKVLQIYYNISAEPNSMTLEELQKEMKLIGVDWSKTVDVWDFSTLTDGLGEIESGVSSLVSAMAKLQEGTKLTSGELADLALKYPELLKQSDLFADTTVDNQKVMLDAVLGSYESEYDALIDTKIAELEATNQLIKDQITLENEKKNKVVEIADLQANGKLDSEREYQKLLNVLHDIEGQNYVTYSDGVLDVNQDMLEDMLTQQGDEVESSKPIWGAQGDMIIEANSKGLSGALQKYPQFLANLRSWASNSLKTLLTNIGTNISKAFSGDKEFVDLTEGISSISSIASHTVTLDTEIEGDYKIDGKSVDEWSSDYKDLIDERVKTLTDQIAANEAIMDNLRRLKGLDLKSIYGDRGGKKSSGSKDSSEVEEYLADIDAYYAALKKLESIQLRRSGIEARIENSDDNEEKIALTKELIDVYQQEAAALEHLNNLRSNTIQTSIKGLEALGFQIEYNAETNEFFVKNLEHLNELQADSVGEYETLQEATNALRENTEGLIDSLDDLNSANQDSTDSIRGLGKSAEDAKGYIVDYLQEIVDKANEVVDGFQDIYTVLTDAAKEYAQNGFLSVDSLQAILELAPKYMEFLYDENGQLILNEQSLQKVIAAKTEEMAAETALSYAKQVLLAAEQAETDTLIALTQANATASDSTWNMAYATLGLAKAIGVANGMDAGYFDDAVSHIQKMQSISKTAVNSISAYYRTLDEGYISQKDGLDTILELTKDMIRQENEDMIDALEGQKDAFADIISLRKEALEIAKKEGEYDDEVEEKIRKIAKLQERINTLSLDDSRDAQAEKTKLEEEMYELQKELADLQADHALDAQTSALDKIQTAFEDQKDDEIAALEDTLSSEEKLYRAAIDRINQGWDALYQDLLSWNYEYGSTLESELVSAWDAASEAVQRYGSFAQAIKSVQEYTNLGNYDTPSANAGNQTYGNTSSIVSQMQRNSIAYWAATDSERAQINANQLALAEQYRQVTGDSIERVDGSWYHDDGSRLYSLNQSDVIDSIVSRMKANGAEYGNASSNRKRELSNESLILGSRLGSYLGKNVYRDSSGEWWIEGRKLFEVYHRGGVAGGSSTLKQDEVMAILKKGEPVLDEKREAALYRIIDFTTALSEKLGKAINSTPISGSLVTAKSGLPALQDAALESITNNQNETVHFGDVYIYGANENTVEQHREVNRQFTNEVLKQLNIRK